MTPRAYYLLGLLIVMASVVTAGEVHGRVGLAIGKVGGFIGSSLGTRWPRRPAAE